MLIVIFVRSAVILYGLLII